MTDVIIKTSKIEQEKANSKKRTFDQISKEGIEEQDNQFEYKRRRVANY